MTHPTKAAEPSLRQAAEALIAEARVYVDDLCHVSADVNDLIEGLADMLQRALASPPPAVGGGEEWRCFHCDEVFTDRACAERHFGKLSVCDEPICTVGAEKYRELERTVATYISESDPSSRAFYEMGARHASELRREEERGYERGLRDARHEEIWRCYLAALPPHPVQGGEWVMDREAVARIIEQAMSSGALIYDRTDNPEIWKATVERLTADAIIALGQAASPTPPPQ